MPFISYRVFEYHEFRGNSCEKGLKGKGTKGRDETWILLDGGEYFVGRKITLIKSHTSK